MLMTPTEEPVGRFSDLPNGPQLLAATVWGRSNSPAALKRRAVEWMKAIEIGQPVRHATPALEAIAWAHEMPGIEEILEPEVWLTLGESLSRLWAEVNPQTLQDQPLVHQLLAGELAWALATRLPRAPFSGRLERTGRAAICLGLNQILDRQGMLPAKHFHILRPLLACWTRCRGLAEVLRGGGLSPRSEQRYQRLVRNALRCTRPDGRSMFALTHCPSPGESGERGGASWVRAI